MMAAQNIRDVPIYPVQASEDDIRSAAISLMNARLAIRRVIDVFPQYSKGVELLGICFELDEHIERVKESLNAR